MKKFIALLLAAIMLAAAVPFAVQAAGGEPTDLPYVTTETIAFIDYRNGSDSASGSTPDSAKKLFGVLRGTGVVSLLTQGGTMVASGIAYMGKSYELPVLRSPLLITSKIAGVDYQSAEPVDSPTCVFKMASGAVFTVQSDVIWDNIIIYQEGSAQNEIVVTNGATMVIGDGVTSMTKRDFPVKFVVESGSRLIVGGGDFEIENRGGEVIEDYTYEYNKTSQTITPDTPEDEPDYSDIAPAVAYIGYKEGSSNYDGIADTAPKKELKSITDSKGAMYMIRGGGTLVAVGILYVGSDYTIPKLGSPLTITGKYNGIDYMNDEPNTNPSGGSLKMSSGKVLTIKGDVRFENMIFFQEGSAQNVIRVEDGATVTFGEGNRWLTHPNRGFNIALRVEKGGTVIFENADHGFEEITGEGVVLIPETASKFVPSRSYDNGFEDVTTKNWFYTYVKTAYEYALANGTSAKKFSPDNKFTVAQALTAAANIHTEYYQKSVAPAASGEAWYVPYVNYCIENGIITAAQFDDYNRNITRGEMATVFASILPDSEYEAVHQGINPDVTKDMACYEGVSKLYKAGIVGGDADKGTYRPNDEIIRSEACVIFTRIAVPDYRIK